MAAPEVAGRQAMKSEECVGVAGHLSHCRTHITFYSSESVSHTLFIFLDLD